ncbi:MAG TPA: gamma-glutamyl-gamma-aminobutyrate hydrolase family protein [Terracidiphilus sp.]|jgi:putative glutamine amidotransferase
MSLRIAIPEPTSKDSAYNQRSLPQYIAAIQSAGASATVVPLHERADRVARLLAGVQGILLPGSGYDVDPQTYGEERIAACEEPDRGRAVIDELLLQDAFNLQKPILAICYGVQALNVWRHGRLIQDLVHEGKTEINHAPGREVTKAHAIVVAPGSRLAELIRKEEESHQVNSSHHQAVSAPGDNLKVTALSPRDGVIEALELDSPDHFVVGVQWHPERTYTSSAFSRAIFAAFVNEAARWKPRAVNESVLRA